MSLDVISKCILSLSRNHKPLFSVFSKNVHSRISRNKKMYFFTLKKWRNYNFKKAKLDIFRSYHCIGAQTQPFSLSL